MVPRLSLSAQLAYGGAPGPARDGEPTSRPALALRQRASPDAERPVPAARARRGRPRVSDVERTLAAAVGGGEAAVGDEHERVGLGNPRR